MGFKKLDNDGEGGYSLFNDGDNAIAKISKISTDISTYQGEFQGYELELRFDAVEEVDEDDEGVLPYWPNSKITLADTDQHTSNLAKLLEVAGVTEQVLRELGAGDAQVEAIMDGEVSYEAESVEENEELAEALLKHLAEKVFRVSTKQRVDSDSGEPNYSQVDRILDLDESKSDLFDGFEVDIELDHPPHDNSGSSGDEEDGSGSESDENGSDKDVIFEDGG